MLTVSHGFLARSVYHKVKIGLKWMPLTKLILDSVLQSMTRI